MTEQTKETPAETQQADQQPEPAPDKSGVDGQQSVDKVEMPRAAFNTRLADAKKSGSNEAMAEILSGLGVDSLEDLKAKFTRLDELEEKHLTEQEKADREAAKRQQEFDAQAVALEAAETKAKEAELELQRYRTRNAIIEASTKAKDAEDVWLWANSEKGKSFLDKIWTEDGTINTDALKALVDACSQDKPHFFGGFGPSTPSNRGATPPTRQEIEAKQVSKKRSY